MSIKGFSVGGNVERYDYNFLDNRPSEITVDTALSDSSTNPVQNSAVTNAINAANGSISSVSGEVDDLKSATSANALNYKNVSIPLDFQQGRVMRDDNQQLYITPSTEFVYCENVLLSDHRLTLKVSEPLRVIWWIATDTASNHGTGAGAPSWNNAPYSETILRNQSEKHLVFCLMRNGGGNLTPQDCSGLVSVTYESTSAAYNQIATQGQVFYVGGTKFDAANDMREVFPLVKGYRVSQAAPNSSEFTVEPNSQFAYVSFENIQAGEITLHIEAGYRYYGWSTNVSQLNDDSGSAQLLTAGWQSGDLTVSTNHNYLAISVICDNGSFGDANPLSVTYRRSSYGKVVNAVSDEKGVIIACKSDGDVVRIGYSSTIDRLLHVSGSNMDWRLCWKDSSGNVYVSPHASIGTLDIVDRGLYRLSPDGLFFEKVISLYNPDSSIPTETDSEGNKDTIWTMCEDRDGNLYAGVYAHGTRVNPAIYKSTDGGLTWSYIVNFATNGMLSSDARHIHAVSYSKWKNAIYCIVGEVNTVLKSTDGGETWEDLNVTLADKGTVLHPTPNGVLIGSDSAYNSSVNLLLNDDSAHVNVFFGWANTIFAIRQSDITGWLYAFTKIDVSVNDTSVFPPATVLDAETETEMWERINTWKGSVSTVTYNAWLAYYRSVCESFPQDCIRPQHYGVLVSKDGGATWEVCRAWSVPSTSYYGVWCVGQFANGECVINRLLPDGIANPLILSEGKHKYVSAGCDFDGEIFSKTNANTIAELI